MSPLSAATSEAPSIKILTSKTWVLPPRPKPGRKPSLDTPTTKRKAQNRAAQRAFRERKAGKIQELEQCLSELKHERNRIEINLTNANNDYSILNKNFNNVLVEKKTLLTKVAQLTERLKIKECPSCKDRLINNSNGVSPFNAGADSTDIISNLSAKITYLEKSMEEKDSYIRQLQLQQQQSQQDRHVSMGFAASSPSIASSMTNSPSPFGYTNGNNNSSYNIGNSNCNTSFFSNNNNNNININNNTNKSHGTVGSNSVSSLPTPSSQHASPFPSTANDGNCGACDKDGCICETIGIKSSANKAASIIQEQIRLEKEQQKRQQFEQEHISREIQDFKPLKAVPLKRKRDAVEEEIDFTKQFQTSEPAPTVVNLNRDTKTSDRSSKQQKLDKFFQRAKKLQGSNNTSANKPDITPLQYSSKHDSHSHSSSDIFSNNDLFKSFVSKDKFEPCGFCSDDSPCVCREALRESKRSISAATVFGESTDLGRNGNHEINEPESTGEDLKLPPILSSNNKTKSMSNNKEKLHVLHPGPTVELNQYKSSPSLTNNGFLPQGPELTVPDYSKEKESSFLIASINKEFAPSTSSGNTKAGCTGNPGTCLQCQTDPMSTLFCTTIASKVSDERSKPISQPKLQQRSVSATSLPGIATSNSNAPSSGPPSDASSTFSSASSSSSASTNNTSLLDVATTAPDGKQLFIPCSDAYKTLSRHEQFKKMDFNSLVGKLTTRGMQVEVQSVVNVLRELDRRLYH